ncbi:hypothetical protein ANN_10253 [Periplaneta americana]|uniref:DNA helicase n=1 Tax=Periplaneta americana TaxID=6978 RepID=A0ABQ8TNI3_PERAM|nr:hypothetical protein ANN_10253 [Periplaneta americana]
MGRMQGVQQSRPILRRAEGIEIQHTRQQPRMHAVAVRDLRDDNNAHSESAMRISYKIYHEIAKELKTFNEDSEHAMFYPTELLHSKKPQGKMPHNLLLSIESPIKLFRNIDPPKLCNGTNVGVKKLIENFFVVEMLVSVILSNEKQLKKPLHGKRFANKEDILTAFRRVVVNIDELHIADGLQVNCSKTGLNFKSDTNKTSLMSRTLLLIKCRTVGFFIFRKLETHVTGEKVRHIEDVIAAAEDFKESVYKESTAALWHRWTKCVCLKWDYFKK